MRQLFAIIMFDGLLQSVVAEMRKDRLFEVSHGDETSRRFGVVARTLALLARMDDDHVVESWWRLGDLYVKGGGLATAWPSLDRVVDGLLGGE